MTDEKFDPNQVQQAHDYLLALTKLAVRFAEVHRAPRYPSGKRENDSEHSFHLALSSTELAADYYPGLDNGLVSQFSLVHDLAESYSGDVWTINISEQDRDKKELAEKEAIIKLMNELPPYTAQLLKRYEAQQEPEARFVRFVDKLLPDMVNSVAGMASTFKDDHDVKSIERLNEISDSHKTRLRDMFPEFEFIHLVHNLTWKTLTESLFKK